MVQILILKTLKANPAIFGQDWLFGCLGDLFADSFLMICGD
jgi:hypothetical protein